MLQSHSETSHDSTVGMDITSPDPAGELSSSPRASEHNQSTSTETAMPTLLGLPLELRMLIYTYVFYNSVLSYDSNGKVLYRPPHDFQNALCRVNKKLRGEATVQLINETKTLTNYLGMAVPTAGEAQTAGQLRLDLRMDARYFNTIETLVVSLDCALDPPYAQLPNLRRLIGCEPTVHAYCLQNGTHCNALPHPSRMRSKLRRLYLSRGRRQPKFRHMWPKRAFGDSERTVRLWLQREFAGDHLGLHDFPKWVPTKTTWQQSFWLCMDNEDWQTRYSEPYIDSPHHPSDDNHYPDTHPGFFDDERFMQVPVTTRPS